MVSSAAERHMQRTANALQCIVNGDDSAVFPVLSLVTLTFDLDIQTRDQSHLVCEFGANPFSDSRDISYTNKKKSQRAPKQNLTQFTACGKNCSISYNGLQVLLKLKQVTVVSSTANSQHISDYRTNAFSILILYSFHTSPRHHEMINII